MIRIGATSPVPSGNVAVVPIADGRVYYDPYSPCGDGKGRWIAVELAQLEYSDGSWGTGVLVGVSTSEDPTGAWTKFIVATPLDSSTPPSWSGQDNGGPDWPQAGFNTNWIVVTAQDFFPDTSGDYTIPLLFAFQRQNTECDATIPNAPAVMATQGAGSGLCTKEGSTNSGTPNSWYCNDGGAKLACPAETYHTYGQDLDGSNLYLIRSNSAVNSGQVQMLEVTGAGDAPTYQGVVAAPNILNAPDPPASATAWDSPLVPMTSSGTTINPGPGDDRFTSCVVRNYGVWAAQTVALPQTIPGVQNASTNAVQWWNIGVDSYLGTIYDFERIGGKATGYTYDDLPTDALDGALAVNSSSDVLVGFTQNDGGTLDAGWVNKNHSDCTELPANGQLSSDGPYFTSGGPGRTGDYGHTAVDPLDDQTFFVTQGTSAAPISQGNYGWEQLWAIVPSIGPTRGVFKSWNAVENECSTHPANCTVTISAPAGAQAGDLLLARVEAGVTKTLSSYPNGCTIFPVENLSNSPYVHVNSGCGWGDTAWLLGHFYTGSSDPGTYSFSVQTGKVTNTCDPSKTNYTENSVNLYQYRNTCQSFVGPAGLNYYHLDGYTANSKTITVGPISPPSDAMTLVALFGSDQESDENNLCPGFSSVSGSPALTLETPLSPSNCPDIVYSLDGDYYPAGSGSYGPYSATDAKNSVKIGQILLVPPW